LPRQRPRLIFAEVVVSDHSSQAGAGSREVVFEFGDAVSQRLVLGGGLPVLVGELLVVMGELVDPLDQGPAADLADLKPDGSALCSINSLWTSGQ
jgi:hypothetical protein